MGGGGDNKTKNTPILGNVFSGKVNNISQPFFFRKMHINIDLPLRVGITGCLFSCVHALMSQPCFKYTHLSVIVTEDG
jgi:hypothetical protein